MTSANTECRLSPNKYVATNKLLSLPVLDSIVLDIVLCGQTLFHTGTLSLTVQPPHAITCSEQ